MTLDSLSTSPYSGFEDAEFVDFYPVALLHQFRYYFGKSHQRKLSHVPGQYTSLRHDGNQFLVFKGRIFRLQRDDATLPYRLSHVNYIFIVPHNSEIFDYFFKHTFLMSLNPTSFFPAKTTHSSSHFCNIELLYDIL